MSKAEIAADALRQKREALAKHEAEMAQYAHLARMTNPPPTLEQIRQVVSSELERHLRNLSFKVSR